nr:capsular biosynthesis protein [Anaerolineae bacterium]
PWTFPLPLWYPLNMDPGTGHAVTNRGGDEAVILFWMNEVYDPEDPDKEPWVPT